MKKIFICFVFCISIASFLCFKDSKKQVIYQGNHYLVSVDGVTVSKIPDSGDYYLADYDCSSKDTVISWDKEAHQLSLSNGNKNSKVSCYLTFESTPKLSHMKKGSFVAYAGNNGCSKEQCSAKNSSYSCGNDNSKFYYDGFRIAYSDNHTAYLISAGATDCVCTNNSGEHLNSCNSSVSLDNSNMHVDYLDQLALRYCNSLYTYQGLCDGNTVRNITSIDFDHIVNRGFDLTACYDLQDGKCGYYNDLIDNGSNYWFTSSLNGLSNTFLYWSAARRVVTDQKSNYNFGIRPVIRMDENVIVVGGSGTSDDPYQIANYSFLVGDMDLKENRLKLSMNGYLVDKMCINLNSTVCTNYVSFYKDYILDITLAREGENIIYAYYKNQNGDIIANISRKFYLEKK